LANTGQHERAAQIGGEELARLDCLGLSGALGGPLHYNLAISLLALGRWSELNERALAAESQVPAGKAARLRLCRAEVAALRGERDRAAELLRSASATIDGPDRLFDAERAIPDAVAARQSGRPRAAVEICRAALSQVPEGLGPIELLRLCAEGLGALADLTFARGRFTRLADPEVALAEFRAAARSRQPRTPEERALSLLCEAEALRLSGPDDAAPALWQEVVAAWDRLRIVYHAGYARMRLAEALVAKRDPVAAGEPLRRAFQIAGQLAAVPLRDETARVAKRGRIPLPSPAPELDGPDLEVLTRREREVLELVSWGRTNREIADTLVISERTVGVHVSRILTKLGASNRAAAARLARGGLPATATKHT
jgi:DNA-binding CsgD family transcriptional regulator